MKVLYVIDTLCTGGAERSILEIASGLKKFKPIVCVVFEKNQDIRDEFIRRGIEIVDLKVKSDRWWLDGPQKLRAVIQDLKPDIVHATLYKSEVITRLAIGRLGMPNIGSFVNDSYSENRYRQQTFIRNVKLNLVRLVDRITSRHVTHFMSITNAIAKSNSKALRIPMSKITTIYRGRDISKFPIHNPSLNDGPFIFLTVARLLKRKGYPELIKASSLLKQRGYNFQVKIAGDGADKTYLHNLAEELGVNSEVMFLGNRKDIPALLSNAHCFVFPSHYEGQGGALVEAMLAGKPIIASDIEVFREQIQENISGLLFKVFDESDLMVKMEYVINNYDQCVLMGKMARNISSHIFNIESTVLQHEQLYLKVLGNYKNF